MRFPPVELIDAENTSRLVSSAYIDEPAIAPLFDDEDERAVLDALEQRTSGRIVAQDGGLEELPADALLTESFGYGWTYVNAAFAYTRQGGNRFNDDTRGAWYAALSVETSLAEVGYHLSRELANCGETENVTRYVQMLAHISGPMASLMESGALDCLSPDETIGYAAGQAFARDVLFQRLSGIKYPSVRHEKGTCLVALVPNVIRKVTRGASFVLTWSGDTGPDITRE